MSYYQATIRISRFIEGLFSSQQGRTRAASLFFALAGVLIIVTGLLIIFEVEGRFVMASAMSVVGMFTIALMVGYHEWLLIFGLILGHSIFYGKPPALGMRFYNAIGPGEVYLFLALVCALVFWYGQKEGPRWPPILLWLPTVLAVYTIVYIMIAFFMWKRQDVALVQAVGWLYFTLAWPAYYCLTSGRIWKPMFLFFIFAVIAGGILSCFAEFGVFTNILQRTNYGGIANRTWGDTAVKTNFLGMGLTATFVAMIILGFAKNIFWRYGAALAFLSGSVIILLDRGRVHYLAFVVCIVLIFLILPTAPRLKSMLSILTSIVVSVLIIQTIGGNIADTFNRSIEKAVKRVELSTPQALMFDPGLVDRQRLLRQAEYFIYSDPLFGNGPGTIFGYDWDWDNRENIPLPFVDNSWLYPLAVVGLVGFVGIMLVYIAFVAANIWAIGKLRNPLHRSIAFVPLVLLVFLLISSTVTWWLVDRFHVAAFALGVAISLALVYHEQRNGSDVPVVEF